MSKTAEMRTLTLGDTKFTIVDGVAVHTVPQDLTESEKEQVRENIGIVGTGEDGKTPEKGTDYWTEADKAEIVNDVLDALPVYSGEVESV